MEVTVASIPGGDPHPSLQEAGILLTSGELNVSVCWVVDDRGKPLCPPGFRQPIAFK